jgi:hypothetical protein
MAMNHCCHCVLNHEIMTIVSQYISLRNIVSSVFLVNKDWSELTNEQYEHWIHKLWSYYACRTLYESKSKALDRRRRFNRKYKNHPHRVINTLRMFYVKYRGDRILHVLYIVEKMDTSTLLSKIRNIMRILKVYNEIDQKSFVRNAASKALLHVLRMIWYHKDEISNENAEEIRNCLFKMINEYSGNPSKFFDRISKYKFNKNSYLENYLIPDVFNHFPCTPARLLYFAVIVCEHNEEKLREILYQYIYGKYKVPFPDNQFLKNFSYAIPIVTEVVNNWKLDS